MSKSLLPGRVLRRSGPSEVVEEFPGVQVDDARLGDVVRADAPLLKLYVGTVHGEGPVWQPAYARLVWSDVSNRRVLGWHPDGRMRSSHSM